MGTGIRPIHVALLILYPFVFTSGVQAQPRFVDYGECVSRSLEASIKGLEHETVFSDLLDQVMTECDSVLESVVKETANARPEINGVSLFKAVREDARRSILHNYIQFLDRGNRNFGSE